MIRRVSDIFRSIVRESAATGLAARLEGHLPSDARSMGDDVRKAVKRKISTSHGE
jgi:hypothetical protein